jgi:hypothetical protein
MERFAAAAASRRSLKIPAQFYRFKCYFYNEARPAPILSHPYLRDAILRHRIESLDLKPHPPRLPRSEEMEPAEKSILLNPERFSPIFIFRRPCGNFESNPPRQGANPDFSKRIRKVRIPSLFFEANKSFSAGIF